MVPLQATLVISWFYNEGVGTAGDEIIRLVRFPYLFIQILLAIKPN